MNRMQKRKFEFKGALRRGINQTMLCTWNASTYATSEAKAKSNLASRAKKELGLVQSAKIVLDGIIKDVGMEPICVPPPKYEFGFSAEDADAYAFEEFN